VIDGCFRGCDFFPWLFQCVAFASTAGRLRNWNAASFASFKKYASHFLNPDFIVTEPKEAANPVTGENYICIFEIK